MNIILIVAVILIAAAGIYLLMPEKATKKASVADLPITPPKTQEPAEYKDMTTGQLEEKLCEALIKSDKADMESKDLLLTSMRDTGKANYDPALYRAFLIKALSENLSE